MRELGLETISPYGLSEAARSHQEPNTLPLCGPMQLLVAQVLDLKRQGIDYLLLPDLQEGLESERGGAQCPWLLDLEAALLQNVPGMPPVLKVPARLGEPVAGLAAKLGQMLTRNPMMVRKALEKTRHLLFPRPKSLSEPKGGSWVGIVAQPYILEDYRLQGGVREALEAAGLIPYFASVRPAELIQEGSRVPLKLELPSDLELAGLSSYLSRLGKVKALVYLSAYNCPPIPPLMQKLANLQAKPWKLLVVGEEWGLALEELKTALEAC